MSTPATHCLECAQNAAALTSALLTKDAAAVAALTTQVGGPANYILGLSTLLSQLATELGEIRGQEPQEILGELAARAYLGRLQREGHPSHGGPDVVD